jgi:hypothetical protein
LKTIQVSTGGNRSTVLQVGQQWWIKAVSIRLIRAVNLSIVFYNKLHLQQTALGSVQSEKKNKE